MMLSWRGVCLSVWRLRCVDVWACALKVCVTCFVVTYVISLMESTQCTHINIIILLTHTYTPYTLHPTHTSLLHIRTSSYVYICLSWKQEARQIISLNFSSRKIKQLFRAKKYQNEKNWFIQVMEQNLRLLTPSSQFPTSTFYLARSWQKWVFSLSP